MSISWRTARNCHLQQRLFLDALTAQGRFTYLRDNHPGEPATPRVLYGGGGFGGKSKGIRDAAFELNAQLAKEGCPRQWGCILSTTYNALADRQISQIVQEDNNNLTSLGELGELKMTSRDKGPHFRFHDPDLGGFYLRNLDEPDKYKGGGWAWVLVDELTESLWSKIATLFYALRSGARLPFKSFGAASNPDGISHSQVKKLWIDRDFVGEEENGLFADDFVFIQALPAHNPMFDSTVEANIRMNPDKEVVRARLFGDWNLNYGGRFHIYNPSVHRFSWQQLRNAFGGEVSVEELLHDENLFPHVWASFDYGTATNSAACYGVHALDVYGRKWTLGELYMVGRTLPQQAKSILDWEKRWPKIRWRYADPALWGRDDEGLSRQQKFRDFGVDFIKANNDRVEGWATLETMLYYEVDALGRVVKEPGLRIHEACVNLNRQFSSAPRSALKPEDVDPRFDDDHALDMERYGMHTHIVGQRQRVIQRPGSVGWHKNQIREEMNRRRNGAWAR